MGDLIEMDLALRHLLAISKISKSFQTSVNLALERVSDTASFCFLVTAEEASFCFCIGLTVASKFSSLPSHLNSEGYVNKIDR